MDAYGQWLQSYTYEGMNLRKGKAVELQNGDFIRIRSITKFNNGEIVLQGPLFQRVQKLDGIISTRDNEVCWVEEIFLDESAEDEEIPIEEVVRIRRLRMTNQAFESLSLERTIPWPPLTADYLEEANLFCRIKYEVVYQNQAQKRTVNSFSFVEKCVRFLQSEEADGADWVDPAGVRAEFRGEQNPRARRHDTSATLQGHPDIDDDVQVIPNPALSQKMYTFGDLFCGGGGMSCGASMAGLSIRWGLDSNITATRTYQMNFPDAVVECTPIEHFLNDAIYPPTSYNVDILHLSLPCQPFSPNQITKLENFEDV